MASVIKEGESVYIPFADGQSVLDSQLRPRMYKSIEQLEKKYPAFRLAKPDIVEYAPVVRCKNCKWFAENNKGQWVGCQMFNAIKTVPEDAPGPEDFCSFGERKE